MEVLCELGGKTCIDMSSVSSTGKQDKVASRTAPVENFESDVWSDRNEALRWVTCTLVSILRRARKRNEKAENH